ncbi:MAG: hypothetical protein IJ511_03630 [Bacteroides sp.]|nr:hypothetical protein [Bacteroides sp.]
MAEKLSCELGINACWIPEGIEISDYRPGDPLSEREIDVYELGRQKKEYHEILERLYHNGDIAYYKCNRYDAKGMLKELAFPTSAMLLDALPQCKIIVSFPQVDTHPEKAGKLDTLTQRYWEAMLSRCLLLGRAPIELIELVGYNPVIDIDWESADSQIIHILAHIADYQELVDKNYAVALEHASWDKRVYTILDTLTGMGYTME